MNPRPGWYPLCLSGDIEPGTSTGTRLFGRELVVWRDHAGASHVWEDRCPHRGMRLSFGFVRGDRIACLYHGWQFDAAGRCRLIPAHPDLKVPPSIMVERYASAERLGIVWVRDHDVDEGPAAGRRRWQHRAGAQHHDAGVRGSRPCVPELLTAAPQWSRRRSFGWRPAQRRDPAAVRQRNSPSSHFCRHPWQFPRPQTCIAVGRGASA